MKKIILSILGMDSASKMYMTVAAQISPSKMACTNFSAAVWKCAFFPHGFRVQSSLTFSSDLPCRVSIPLGLIQSGTVLEIVGLCFVFLCYSSWKCLNKLMITYYHCRLCPCSAMIGQHLYGCSPLTRGMVTPSCQFIHVF